jgi:hypothetical protein
MAEISSIKFKEDGIFLGLKISREEYEFLGRATKDIIAVPAGSRLDRLMTTGKLGNSTRLMLPKKALDRLEAKKVDRKALGTVFKIDGSIYIIVRLHSNRARRPGSEE